MIAFQFVLLTEAKCNVTTLASFKGIVSRDWTGL
jgi:hypothetical protein